MENNIINNTDLINLMIQQINNSLESLMPNYHNTYSLFMTQRCNIYSIILTEIFKENATSYENQSHIITKIGNHYYDVRGCIDLIENIKEYHECPQVYLYDVIFIGIGNYKPEFDDQIINLGVQVGKKFLNTIDENKKIPK